MSISPVLHDYPTEMLAIAIVVGALLLVGGLIAYTMSENLGLLAMGLFAGGMLIAAGIYYMTQDDTIDNDKTLAEISSEFDVVLPKLTTLSTRDTNAEFELKMDESQVITVDIVDSTTREIYENARILWDGEEISLMVKESGAEEYVPLRD